MLHRDIKPENILLGEVGQVLIGDLGLAINVVRERPVPRVGTLDYMAPEVSHDESHTHNLLHGHTCGKPAHC